MKREKELLIDKRALKIEKSGKALPTPSPSIKPLFLSFFYSAKRCRESRFSGRKLLDEEKPFFYRAKRRGHVHVCMYTISGERKLEIDS